MRSIPSKRLRGLLLTSLLLAAAAASASCRGAQLPAAGTPEYAGAVRAFYVGLSALQVGDDVRAEAELRKATALAPDEPAAWADLGLLYLRQRQFEQAAAALERARLLAPDNADVHVLLGRMESGRGDYAAAAGRFRRASELDPRHLKALYALSREVEREGAGGEPEVLRLLRKILETQPANLSVRLDVARLAAKRGDAELFGAMLKGLEADSATWPPEAREQLAAVRAAAAGGDTRPAATRVQVLRNVLVRLPEYRQSRLAVEDPPEILSEPFTRFLRLESPSPNPAPPDEALTYEVGASQDAEAAAWAGAVSLTGEGAPVVLFADAVEVRLAGGAKLAFPGGPSAAPPAPYGIAPLDFDYDFKTDLALAGAGGFRLYRQESPTSFADVTAKTGLPGPFLNTACKGAWPADIEADGDLDIVLGLDVRDGPPAVLRNNGDGTFAALYPFKGPPGLSDFVWADLDADGDPDAALLDSQGHPFVFTNERAGQFSPRALPQVAARPVALGAADVNKDGRFDLLALGGDGVLRRLSDRDEGAGWETAEVLRWEAPPAGLAAGALKLTAADLDNNGGMDLLVSAPSGARAWLSDAAGQFRPLKLPDAAAAARAVSVADANADGRLDLVGVSADARGFVATARGAKGYHWQVIRPRAANATGDQRINSFGVGGEMEIRAGLLTQKQLITGPVVHFGLGEQAGADVVRVVWPNGSVRAEFELGADQSVLAEQRLKGSCPSLFAYDGRAMSFVKDCAPWSPAIGLRINNYQTAKVQQTEEWVRVRGDQLAARGGFYDLRITAELWETYYLDRYALAVVDHPAGTEVFVDERTANRPPELKVYTLEATRPFKGAWDDAGADVSEVVRSLDGRHLDTFGRGAYQGVTRDHFVELELPAEAPAAGPLWLVAHGWLHPTDASINVAISQGARPPPKGLSLEVADGRGGWAVARPDLGFPAGKNKTVLVDLGGVFTPGAPRRLRLRTNMEIYWDALAWAAEARGARTEFKSLAPAAAELRFRGFSEMGSAGASSPETPRYDRVASTGQRWRDLVGYYTRFGDVRELLERTDDRVVIANAGDELLLRFAEQPPPPPGRARDYVLVGNGWIKDGDFNSMFSKTVLPLPSRDREHYTTPPTRLEDDPVYRRHARDWQDFHTRYVTPRAFRGGLWPR